MEDQDPNRARRLRTYALATQALVVLALAASIVYGATSAPAGRGLLAAFAAFLIAAAPFALGVLVGFLFGIPKTHTEEAGAAGAARVTTQPNTNLEQVSDWLTKILVGVGLTQLTRIPEQVENVAEYLVHTIHASDPGAEAAIATILVFFSIAGFLTGFLVTRLILEREFARREPDPGAVERLMHASPPNSEGDAVDEHDAAELLRFPLAKLKTKEQLIAWGRAKLEHDPAAALPALDKALRQAPSDRLATENLVFAALYLDPPEGFRRAIDAATSFLQQPGYRVTAEDADLFGYLAAAYGQQYRWARERGEPDLELTTLRLRAVDAARRAIELAPRWKLLLHKLAHPAPGSREDDLVALANDPELRTLLGS